MQSGAHAAHTIVRRLEGKPTKPFRYRDLGTLAVISRFTAVAKIGPVQVGGFVGWLLWLVVHITFLTGFKNRFGALARWAVSFVGRGRYERALTGRWVARAKRTGRICLRFRPEHTTTQGDRPMPINVTPIAGLSDHINDIRLRTARIVNERILPNESLLWRARGGNATDEERAEAKALRQEIQDEVKAEGLWAPHLPPEYGGMGIDFMAHAYMNEILAYAVGAASLFGVVAPELGQPDHPGQVRDRGAEAEVAPPAHRGDHAVGLLHDRARERRLGPALHSDHRHPRGRRVGDQRAQVVHLQRAGGRLLHRDVPGQGVQGRRGPGADGPDHRADLDTRASIIERGIGIWGSAKSDHCEVRYDNVRVPAGEPAGPGRRRAPGGPGPARRRAASSTA